MKAISVCVYVVSYETAFGNCIEDFRTYDKSEAEAAVNAYADDGIKAFIDSFKETVYR